MATFCADCGKQIDPNALPSHSCAAQARANREAAAERRRQQNEELKARDRERRAACAREGHTPLGDTCSRCGISMNFKGRRAHVRGRIR